MKPERIQLSRARGWRMPPNTLKVDRTTPWGNPLLVGSKAERWWPLRGRDLACWCRPGTPCHGEVLLRMANGKRGQALDIDELFSGWGYRFEGGRPVKVGDAQAAR